MCDAVLRISPSKFHRVRLLRVIGNLTCGVCYKYRAECVEVAARLTLSISQRAQHLNVERRLKPRVPLLPFKHRAVGSDIGDNKVESEKSRVAAFSLDVSLV